MQRHHVNVLSKHGFSPYKERKDHRPKFRDGTGCDFKESMGSLKELPRNSDSRGQVRKRREEPRSLCESKLYWELGLLGS